MSVVHFGDGKRRTACGKQPPLQEDGVEADYGESCFYCGRSGEVRPQREPSPPEPDQTPADLAAEQRSAEMGAVGAQQTTADTVRIYTRADCQYCAYAKELLTERGVAFREVDIGEDYILRGWCAWATGSRILPQVFIGGEPIGGFADLMTMDAKGELLPLVEKASSKRAQVL